MGAHLRTQCSRRSSVTAAVGNFVMAYVADYKRQGILGESARDRELAETIGREILMAWIVAVHDALPAFLWQETEEQIEER